ncbi:outer membrane lipoprotein carrier protein LolA [Kangiella shandongensis]|uniref:outer membrane lipoprotein carrier protein LolA n=1 Tax=Kangiella shandongensis TaxID=2763258 RepID=UPI001CBD7BB5|nr:outer membrane lipoprotein carrier protein LolA [Kangiella shandongensis]
MKIHTFKFSILLLLAALVALISPQISSATDEGCELNAIATKLQSQPELSRFEQEKSIKVLSKPLYSSGYLLLSQDSGLVWQTLEPIKSTTVITDTEFKQYNKSDQLISLPDNGNQPASQLISSTFLAILSGSFTELDKNFTVATRCDDSQWTISLTPTNSTIDNVMHHITVTGSQRIQRIAFTEANDDVTQLSFTPDTTEHMITQLREYLVD